MEDTKKETALEEQLYEQLNKEDIRFIKSLRKFLESKEKESEITDVSY